MTDKGFRSSKAETDTDKDIVIPEPNSEPATGGSYDIGGIAEQSGSTQIPFVDDRLIGEDGALKDLDPAATQARENAVRLGNGSADAVLNRTTREAGRYHSAAEAKKAEYDGAQTELIAATRGLVQASNLEQWATAARDNTR